MKKNICLLISIMLLMAYSFSGCGMLHKGGCKENQSCGSSMKECKMKSDDTKTGDCAKQCPIKDKDSCPKAESNGKCCKMKKVNREEALAIAPAASVGIDEQKLNKVDEIIKKAIDAQDIPGAVLVIGRNGKIIKKQTYGNRALTPEKEDMSLDTIFDLASVSKACGTTAMTMKLVEEGKINLDDPIAKYIPNYAKEGKGDVRVRDHLTHASGLKAYTATKLADEQFPTLSKPDALIEHISTLPKQYETANGYTYSCLNFLILQRVNETASGVTADQYLKANVWEPLSMTDTTYEVPKENLPRTAPTTKKEDGSFYRGEVHDPLANYYKKGPACPGNAGLFSTAEDLSIYARVLLNGGEFMGTRVFEPTTVELMMDRMNSASLETPRTFGWGMITETPWSTGLNRTPGREIISHTGWTGTYVWMDKYSKTFMILLSNREHPPAKGNIGDVRKFCADAVLRSVDTYKEYFEKNP